MRKTKAEKLTQFLRNNSPGGGFPLVGTHLCSVALLGKGLYLVIPGLFQYGTDLREGDKIILHRLFLMLGWGTKGRFVDLLQRLILQRTH